MKKVFLIIISSLFSIFLLAQNLDTIRIQEVIIPGSPINYKVINLEKTIKTEKSTGQLMQQIPGVTITKRSSFAIEPSINNFKYDQINTTINGGLTASNSCPNRMDPITTRISPDEIKELEIVRGPFEVKHGQIMGGFINLITSENPNYEQFNLNGNIVSEYNFNGNGRIVSTNIKTGSKTFDVDINANYRKFDNYISGDETEISSAYETYGISTGLGFNISKQQRIFMNYIYSEARDVMHAGLPMDAKYDKSNMVSLNYEFNEISKTISSFKIKLFGANEDHLMTNEYRPNSKVSLANTPVFSTDFGGRFILELNPVKNGLMNFGADFNLVAKDGNKEVTQYKNPCTTPPTIFNPPKEKVFEVWQNSNNKDFGAFIDFKYDFSKNISVKTGLRSDFIKSGIKSPEQDFINLYDGDIKPSNILNFNYYATVKFVPTENYYVELSAGHGTRNPGLLEQFINHFTVGLDAYEYVGNPHLNSESNNQINLMVSKTHKNFHTYIDLFYSQINNYITAVVDSTIPRKFTPCKEPKFAKRFTNIANAQQYGFNFGAKIFFLKHYSANLDLTYVYAENLDLKDPLPETAPFTSFFTLTYKNKNLQINMENEFQAKQVRISSLVGERESEEFTVFNINTSYLFFEKLNIGMAVNNIFDVNYYRHLSRPYKNMDTTSMFYEPGRNFRLFLKYVF